MHDVTGVIEKIRAIKDELLTDVPTERRRALKRALKPLARQYARLTSTCMDVESGYEYGGSQSDIEIVTQQILAEETWNDVF